VGSLGTLYRKIIMEMNLYNTKFEDAKGVIRSRKSKDRQYNGQNKKDKKTKNRPQNTIQKTKDLSNINSTEN
jgi:hypothetical protein